MTTRRLSVPVRRLPALAFVAVTLAARVGAPAGGALSQAVPPRIAAFISLDAALGDVAVDPAANLVYATTAGGVAVLDGATNAVIATVASLDAAGILIAPATKRAYPTPEAARTVLTKPRARASRATDDLDLAVRQIVSSAVASQGVVDIFAATGLDRPDPSVLSDEFLAEVRDLPQKNLAIEALRRLLEDEVRARSARNVVQNLRALQARRQLTAPSVSINAAGQVNVAQTQKSKTAMVNTRAD